MTAGVKHAGRELARFVPAQAAVLVALGLLLARLPAGTGATSSEDAVDRYLAGHRGGTADAVSSWLSELAATPTITVVTALCVLALLLRPRGAGRRQAAFLGGAVALQALVFLTVTACVDRARPDVVRLDAAPPTSSFPSGHTGAALALYGGLAVLAHGRVRRPWRGLVCTVLLLVPLLVGLSRLYRGMHHPTDVAAGLVNGSASLVAMGLVLLTDRPRWAAENVPGGRTAGAGRREHVPRRVSMLRSEPAVAGVPGVVGMPAVADVPGVVDVPAVAGRDTRRPAGAAPPVPVPVPLPGAPGAPGAARRAVVVVNPLLVDAATRESVRRTLESFDYRDPVFGETTAADPGAELAAEAVRSGASLVVACGGDGTVTACAGALAGTGVALAVVPCGTGNLLARNLRLTGDPASALRAALACPPWYADLALADGDGMAPTHVSAMAGVGLDAEIMAGANRRLKNLLGWPAYGLAGLRRLRSRPIRVSLSLDGAVPFERQARMVVVGNIGTLQGGLCLLPAARPDDGVLDVVVFDPRGAGDWLRALARMATGRGAGAPLETFRAGRIDLSFDRASRRELDGEPLPPGRNLRVTVRPGVLLIHAPRPAGDLTATAPPEASAPRPRRRPGGGANRP